MRVVGEGDEAVDAVREGGGLGFRQVSEMFSDNLLHRVKGESHLSSSRHR